jgi:Rod binding domain-containing protein
MEGALALPPTTGAFRPPAGLTAAAGATGGLPPEKLAALKKIAEEFEGMVLKEMMSPMFEGLETDGLGGGGAGEAMFRPMLLDNYAKGMAKGGGIGVAGSVLKELVRMQGGQTDGVAG